MTRMLINRRDLQPSRAWGYARHGRPPGRRTTRSARAASTRSVRFTDCRPGKPWDRVRQKEHQLARQRRLHRLRNAPRVPRDAHSFICTTVTDASKSNAFAAGANAPLALFTYRRSPRGLTSNRYPVAPVDLKSLDTKENILYPLIQR